MTAQPLELGRLRIWPPVILAPMAGVTNYPFRRLCRDYGAGLAISEMVTARPLVERRAKTLKIAGFGPKEAPRSLQLYGVDPYYVAEAVRQLKDQALIDHLDLNFGCPVRKVTSKGGGAALPLKPRLLAAIVAAAVRSAGDIPVTLKFRLGIDDDHLTYLPTGHIAEQEGCAAVTLHARTAAQMYAGQAKWDAIAELRQALRIPVLGNGDIWEAKDAMAMMGSTGCYGVVVGRGCLGRPWLFRELADAFSGRPPSPPPNLGAVCRIMLEHAGLLADWLGEPAALRMFRRQSAWYTKGFRGSARIRSQLSTLRTLEELALLLNSCDPTEPFPAGAARLPRAKSGQGQKVSLPPGYLDDPDDASPPCAAEAALGHDGG